MSCWIPVFDALAARGFTRDRCAALVALIDERPESRQPVVALRTALRDAGVACEGDQLERALLACAAQEARRQVPALPLYEPVKQLLVRELDKYEAAGAGGSLDAESFPFAAAAKIATLRRFPAGAFDWEVHGLRRSVLLHVGCAELPRVLSYLTFRFRGFGPAMFLHVALPPRNRSLILEREVRLTHYRVARSLALQPEMKGILAEAWFLDPAAVRDSPHLAAINEPYVDLGGLRALLGVAPPDAGFMERNAERKRAFDEGRLRYRLGLGVWARDAAIRWAESHPEWEGM